MAEEAGLFGVCIAHHGRCECHAETDTAEFAERNEWRVDVDGITVLEDCFEAPDLAGVPERDSQARPLAPYEFYMQKLICSLG